MQQHLPFTVLKLANLIIISETIYNIVATALTVYGIETSLISSSNGGVVTSLQQYLPFKVCDERCERAEEQSNDEVRTSLVPDRKEGKTTVIKQ